MRSGARHAVAIAVAMAVTIAGCGSTRPSAQDNTVPVTQIECVPVTTLPGQVTAVPDLETCETLVRTLPPTCDGPAAEPSIPTGGWLGGAPRPDLVRGEISRTAPEPVDGVPGLDLESYGTVSSVVRSDRTVIYCTADGSDRLEDAQAHWTVTFADESTLDVWQTQLVQPLELFNVASNDPPVELDGGRQVIRSDLFVDGSVRTVWLVTPDGLLATVRAAGANAVSVFGWPTTIPTIPDQPPPSEAGLTLDQLEAIAEILLESQ